MNLSGQKAQIEAQLAAKSKAITQRMKGLKGEVIGSEEEKPVAQPSQALVQLQKVSQKIPNKVWIGAALGVAVLGIVFVSRKEKKVASEIPLQIQQDKDGKSYVLVKQTAPQNADALWAPLRAVGKVVTEHVIALASDTILQLIRKQK